MPQKILSLRNSLEFRAVYDNGGHFDSYSMSVFILPNQLNYHRLGITASRRVSLRAIDRNRLKRLIREVFRLSEVAFSCTMPCYDWVINAKRSLLKSRLDAAMQEFRIIVSNLLLEQGYNCKI